MSALTIFTDTEAKEPVWHSTDAEQIREQLNAKDVRFERWEANQDLGANPTPETVINAYQHAIDKLVEEKGYQSWMLSAFVPITRKKTCCAPNSSPSIPTAKMKCVSLLRVQGCSACIWMAVSIRSCARKTI